MKKLAILLLLMFNVQCSLFNCIANDGVYYTSGNVLMPLIETDIAAKKEILEITLGRDSFAYVTVDYTFYNNSDAKTVTMAFEAAAPYNAWAPFSREGIHPFIQDFTVLFNGQELQHRNAVIASPQPSPEGEGVPTDFTPLDLTQWKSYEELPDSIQPMDNLLVNPAMPDSFCSFAYAYYFDAPFQKGENRVRHTYRYKMSWGVGRDYEVSYTLTPVTRWANGQVDDFTLRIKSETDREIIMNDSLFLSAPFKLEGIGETYQLQSDYWGYSQCLFAPLLEGNVLEWHGTDFAPKENIRIEPLYLLKGGVRGFSNIGKVVVEKDGRESRYIADAGDNYFVEAQDYGLVPKTGARVEQREARKGQGFVCLKDDIRRANVRQEPSMKGKVLFTLDNPEGMLPEYYPCLDFVSHKEADGFYKWWYKVKVNGKIGYISEMIVFWDSIRL
ncbi:MAG: hypothetical protein IKQ37_12390 [Bacteroidaceae bacterium]|nr:hypothetical protein [Bacteroidaceae bacterium]